MSAAVKVAPVEQVADADDPTKIWHAFCGACWPVAVDGQIALCGTQRPAGETRYTRPETVCVVCDELFAEACGVCGS
jgi:hypothetical protein